MSKNNKSIPENADNSNDMQGSKSGGSFLQNPDQNNSSRKAALGPNTKR